MLLILTLSIISCKTIKTSENVVVLLSRSERESWYYDGAVWKPNQTDVDFIESFIPKIISDHREEYNVREIYENIDNYNYQLVPYLDENDRKIIYINGLCKGAIEGFAPEWKSEFLNFDDGYSCFWQARVDMEKKECFYFMVN